MGLEKKVLWVTPYKVLDTHQWNLSMPIEDLLGKVLPVHVCGGKQFVTYKGSTAYLTRFDYRICTDCDNDGKVLVRPKPPAKPPARVTPVSDLVLRVAGVDIEPIKEEDAAFVFPRAGKQYTPKALTGGSSDYYKVFIEKPTTEGVEPYMAECNDIIEALDMDYANGNVFKAQWRIAATKQGKGKAGGSILYDAEKSEFFSKRQIKRCK